MTATLNVNLTPCDCDGPHPGLAGVYGAHTVDCAAIPILLPCRLPESFTCEVALGECTLGCQSGPEHSRPTDGHWTECPARPVRVSCSIRGKTWPESEVTEVDGDYPDGDTFLRAQRACVERWPLVRAAVTGSTEIQWYGPATRTLFEQRDAVYAALVKRVRAEEAGDAADSELARIVSGFTNHHLPTDTRVSAAWLHAYVEHLIEQVGGLT